MSNSKFPISNAEIKKFQKEILDWYELNKRDLPWRHTRNPYSILVSEIMAQQTQLSRVVPKYLAWMEEFPTIQSLAKASTREVLRHWSGLGYNRRALYLQEVAKELVISYSFTVDDKKNSSRVRSNNKILKQVQNDTIKWPQTEEELRKLPGIGEYTARAILCFAFGKQVAVVDTNVRRVILTRIMNQESRIKNKKTHTSYFIPHNFPIRSGLNKEIKRIAEVLLPVGRAYEWNQALMDYSSAVLKKEYIPPESGTKQSKFKTSNRFYRGQIIRLLLKKNQASAELFGKIENNGITKEQFEDILIKMEKDGLIKKKVSLFWIPD